MTCTEIKEGSPRHLHRLIRGGLSPTVGDSPLSEGRVASPQKRENHSSYLWSRRSGQ